MPGNNSGPSRTRAIEPRYRPPEQQGILGEGGTTRGGKGPGRQPFRRSLLGTRTGLDPGATKINTRHTQRDSGWEAG
jgi:hypothetical protein